MEPNTTKVRPRIKGIYTAILTQAGTAAPTAVVLNNTLGQDVTWVRYLAGRYMATVEEPLFTVTTAIGGGISGLSGATIQGRYNSELEFEIQTTVSGAGTDDYLYNTAVEIRVYNT